jgi:broad specificity phosphatase PhoE
MSPKHLILVRHGHQRINDLTPQEGVPVDADNGLSASGLKRADASGTALAGIVARLRGCTVGFVTSPELRCMQTAAPLVDALSTQLLPDSRLRDRRFDPHVVTTVEEMRAWQEAGWNNPLFRAGAAESVVDHRARVSSWVGDLQAAAYDTVVVVASATTIEHISGTLLGVPAQAMATGMIPCDHLHLHVWQFVTAAQGQRAAQLLRVNVNPTP